MIVTCLSNLFSLEVAIIVFGEHYLLIYLICIFILIGLREDDGFYVRFITELTSENQHHSM